MKKEKMKKHILILTIISIFTILFITYQVAAYQRSEIKDGLIGRWHPGALCISCHYSLSTTEKAQSISAGCKCHDKIYIPKEAKNVYEIDNSKIFDLHKNIICVRCHISTKKDDANFQDLHSIKSRLKCTQCHVVENATVKIPEKKKCFECHNGDPHVAHSNKTEKLCPVCHGEFGERYIENNLLNSEKEMLPIILVKNESVVVKEYPTLVDFVINIVKSIISR